MSFTKNIRGGAVQKYVDLARTIVQMNNNSNELVSNSFIFKIGLIQQRKSCPPYDGQPSTDRSILALSHLQHWAEYKVWSSVYM